MFGSIFQGSIFGVTHFLTPSPYGVLRLVRAHSPSPRLGGWAESPGEKSWAMARGGLLFGSSYLGPWYSEGSRDTVDLKKKKKKKTSTEKS